VSRLVASLAAAAAVALGVPAVAGAEPAQTVEAAWWWRLRPTAALAAPASPTGDGLLVQGAPDGPVAVAAVRATLPAGATAPTLTLRVAPGFEQAGDGAVIVACPATSPWKPVQAGPWDERPAANCGVSAVGLRAPDGSAFTFDLTTFPLVGGRLDVVLAPGRVAGPAGADGSVFAVELAAPQPGDVSAAVPAAPPQPDAPAAAGEPETDAPADSGMPELARLPDAAPFDLAPAPLPDVALRATGAAPGRRAAPGPAATAERAAGVVAAQPADRSRSARAWALVVLAAGLGVLAWAATRPVPLPRPLVALAGRPSAEPPETSGVTGGLGRFRRRRHGPPPRLV
jgi:hypothetical protein